MWASLSEVAIELALGPKWLAAEGPRMVAGEAEKVPAARRELSKRAAGALQLTYALQPRSTKHSVPKHVALQEERHRCKRVPMCENVPKVCMGLTPSVRRESDTLILCRDGATICRERVLLLPPCARHAVAAFSAVDSTMLHDENTSRTQQRRPFLWLAACGDDDLQLVELCVRGGTLCW